MKDYYKILEIEYGANILTVKKAYRRLALKYHPDKNKNVGASQKFIEITEAYEVLRDPEKKKQYDNLYKLYYSDNKQKVHFKDESDSNLKYTQHQRKWAEYGEQKAKEYSSIPFEEFARRLLKEISVGANYIPNIFAMLFTIGGAVGLLVALPGALEISGGFGLFVVALIIGLGFLTYKLFLVAQADYKEERKQKITNIK